MDQYKVFNRAKLSEGDLEVAKQLTTVQAAYLKNLIIDIMEEKLRITFDPQNPLAFAQQEAYLRGQMDIALTLLNTSEESSRSISI